MEAEHPKTGGLTPLGRKQAQKVGERLKQYKITSVHVSTMLRAQETAQLIVEALDAGLKYQSTDLLIEGIPGLPKSMQKEKKLDVSEVRKTKARMDQAFERYFTPYKVKGEKHIALVCHGNLIRYLVTKVLDMDTKKWINFDIVQCSLTTVSIAEDGRMKVVTFGEVGHIYPEKKTFL